MADLAVREADWARADTLIHRKFGDTLPYGDQVLLAYAYGDTMTQRRLLRSGPAVAARRGRRIAGRTLEAATWLGLYLENLEAAEQFARFAAAVRDPALAGSAHGFLAGLEIGRGRWSAARGEFLALERRGHPDSALVLQSLAATLPFLSVPRADLESAHRRLAAWAPAAAGQVGPLGDLRPHLRLYLMGLLSSRLGRTAAAMRHAQELAGLAAPAEVRPLIRSLAGTVRGDAAWQSGRAVDALRALDEARGAVPLELIGLPYFSEEHARFLRGWLLHRLGRDDEALAWIEHGFTGTPQELQYRAPAHSLQAEILHARGDGERAARHYSRFVSLWSQCDPALRPAVEQAREQLARLSGESP